MSFNGPVPVRISDGVSNATLSTIGPKVALDVSISKDTTVSTPSILNVSMPVPGTEYNTVIAAFTKEFSIKSRDGGTIQFAYIAGDSGINYITVPAGSVFTKSNIYSSSGITLYFQCNKITTLEVMLWS